MVSGGRIQLRVAGCQLRVGIRHRGRSVWAFVAFLALFYALLALVTKVYLLRALTDFKYSDDRGRKLIGLHALLLMSLLLVILGLSLILIFRIGRYFFPSSRKPEPKTKYTDAWTEAGKRAKTPEE
jgi:quinol-cytochrome oxidoreductase complex cytochrome b subunit